MIDPAQKNAILAAEAEFERRENLARALAVSGVTLIGKITSPPDPEQQDPRSSGNGTAPPVVS